MRLVPYALDQVQRLRVRWEYRSRALPRHEETLLARAPVRTLRHPQQHPWRDSHLLQRRLRLCQLAWASIDEEHVGQRALPRLDAPEASRDGLAQRAVVVARLDPLDVEAAVFLLRRPLRPEDDAGGDGGFALRVADVEALDSPRGRFEPQRRTQRLELLGHAGTAGDLHLEGVAGILGGQLDPARFQAAARLANRDFPRRAGTEGLGQHRSIGHLQ